MIYNLLIEGMCEWETECIQLVCISFVSEFYSLPEGTPVDTFHLFVDLPNTFNFSIVGVDVLMCQ